MNQPPPEPALRPPTLDGLNPSWSRLVTAPTAAGPEATWHVLDNGVINPRLTLLCVHGNPSWSYLWRRLLAEAPADVRVIAPDHLGMGYSERTGHYRRLADRVEDLGLLTAELGVDGPVITVAHDWGGPISLGWAENHRDQLAGLVLLNTAVHQPPGSPAPAAIRMIRRGPVLGRFAVDTTAFLRSAIEMSRPRLPPEVRRALLAPYATAARRRDIAHFVEDIPLDPSHPTAGPLDSIAAGLDDLSEIPALLLWGPSDLVFSDLHLHDLEERLPQAQVHRFGGASHFVSEEVDVVTPIYDWLASQEAAPAPHPERDLPELSSLLTAIDDRSRSSQVAVIEGSDRARSISFARLHDRVERLAAGLSLAGIVRGTRVAVMIPPGIDLTVVVYACWRAGAVLVLIDAGLGPRGMTRALASAAPDHLIGVDRALAASRALRWPGQRFSLAPLSPTKKRLLGVADDLASLERGAAPAPPAPKGSDRAAVVFTSGSTGPSKGVLYRHHQIRAQVDALGSLYGISAEDRLVAAFAPFALYGPAFGMTSVTPDMDVTAPDTLTAPALGDAAIAADATLIFASPAALATVVRTTPNLSRAHRGAFGRVRLVLSAGAPIRPSLLQAVAEVFPHAEIHTPYGMTEVLPVADISYEEIRTISAGDGACVGFPLASAEVRISPLDPTGQPTGALTSEPGTMGEVVVRADHARDGYDRLWHTQYLASQPPGWHRSGDVGYLDDDGRLWIGGRIGHVITTPDGPITPVRPEHAIEDLDGVAMAAVVGVGPVGAQQTVAVVELDEPAKRPRQATQHLQDAARSATDLSLAAVLVVPRLPVDRRHNSKIDRPRVAEWASAVLAGGPMRRL